MGARVALIDSGGANIASLEFALQRLGADTVFTADPAVIRAAPRVILPGVGAAAAAMGRLRASGLDRVIPELRQPVLGICLGMQLLFDSSAEGETACLGVLPGRALRFAQAPDLPVPQMGWNRLTLTRRDPLFEGIVDGDHVYFIHSYALPPGDCTLATAEYGGPFSAAVGSGNFLGAQFHPERSGRVGARVLKNFLSL